MIAKLKQLFTKSDLPLSAQEIDNQVNLAAASLLLEVVFADDSFDAEEMAILPEQLAKTAQITLADASQVIEDAKRAQRDATSLYEFTREINQFFDLNQKKQLLLAMWHLAYADGELCRYEDQIIRRTAGLLHLKQSELIMTRNIALENKK